VGGEGDDRAARRNTCRKRGLFHRSNDRISTLRFMSKLTKHIRIERKGEGKGRGEREREREREIQETNIGDAADEGKSKEQSGPTSRN